MILRKIQLKSYIKLLVIIFLGFGIAMSFIFLVISLLGGDVHVYFGPVELYGISAGLVQIIVTPSVFAFVGLIFSLLSFLPFKAAMRISDGIRILGEFKIESTTTIQDITKEN